MSKCLLCRYHYAENYNIDGDDKVMHDCSKKLPDGKEFGNYGVFYRKFVENEPCEYFDKKEKTL